MNTNIKCLVFLLMLLPVSCKPQSKDRTENEQRSFCYWDTKFSVDNILYKNTTANHLYIRYFDVDWDDVSSSAKPIASISRSQDTYYDIEKNTSDTLIQNYTPSIFLTNRVFQKASTSELDSLSSRLIRRLDNINSRFAENAFYKRDEKIWRNWNYSEYESYKIRRDSVIATIQKDLNNRYSEILIDCDWTEKTKDNFFYFIRRLKKDFKNKNITVTLRLWQYKNTKTAGVPPVERCLLMCYNMQTANDFNVENSIASLDELKKYVSGEKYPLKLDVALPVFNWGILFRNEKFIGLLGNIDINSYQNNPIEYQNIGNNKFILLQDKIVGNFFARKGDIIRVESVSKNILNDMANYLKSEIPMDNLSRVTFFSWNKTYINNYGTNEIENIYNLFGK